MVTKKEEALKIGELPQLRIVSIQEIRFHEDPDAGRSAKLLQKLSEAGTLKNPLVVARVAADSCLILLDGANRISALKELGARDVLVQELDFGDPGLVLREWHHAVERITGEEILTRARLISGARLTPCQAGNSVRMKAHEVLCRLTFPNQTEYELLSAGNLFQQVALLRQFTNLYLPGNHMDRVSYTNLEHLQKNYRQFSLLVSFRHFSKNEILQLTDNGIKLPSGITRILLPKRALRFNVPLEILCAEQPVAEKNHWLGEAITAKIRSQSIRFYQEPTFLFDE